MKQFLNRAGVIILLLLLTAGLQAQNGQRIITGPDGAVLQLLGLGAAGNKLDATNKLEIWKSSNRTDKGKKIAELGFPSSARELQQRVGESIMAEIKQHLKAANNEAAYRTLSTYGTDTLGFLIFSKQVLEAIGLLYTDKSWKSSQTAVYNIYQSTGGTKLHTEEAKSGNNTYATRFTLSSFMRTDSTVSSLWAAPLSASIPLFAQFYKQTGYGKAMLAQPGYALIYTKGDSAYAQFGEAVQPGSLNAYTVRVTDWAGNLGPSSDTLFTTAINTNQIEGITGFTVTDTLNGLLLSWNSLPNTAVYAAVQILKSRQAGSDYVIVDTVAASENRYLDRKILSNVNYYYKIQPILTQLPGKDYMPFAEASGAQLKAQTAKPAAPQGVRASNERTGIRISWDQDPALNLFGYYILRGTSVEQLQVISAVVRDTTYTDSLFSAQESGQYLYAVQAMNMDQQLGDTSQPVSVLIRQPVVLPAPGGIQARRAASGVTLEWDASVFGENGITGYILYRREKGATHFKQLTADPVTVPFFNDEQAAASMDFEYGVTATDAWGNQSILSPLAIVVNDISASLPVPANFSLRNSTTGIIVSWPTPYASTSLQYCIYRKAVTEKQFKKIGTVSPMVSYTDKTALKNTLYEYALSVTDGKQEGDRTIPSSIRRQ